MPDAALDALELHALPVRVALALRQRTLDGGQLAAAKLLALLSQSTAERLRAMSQQLQIYAQLIDALHQELQRAR